MIINATADISCSCTQLVVFFNLIAFVIIPVVHLWVYCHRSEAKLSLFFSICLMLLFHLDLPAALESYAVHVSFFRSLFQVSLLVVVVLAMLAIQINSGA